MTVPSGTSFETGENRLDRWADMTTPIDLALPDAISSTHPSVGTFSRKSVWRMLVVRSLLALAFQAFFAFGFFIAGVDSPWRAASDWWLVWFSLAEVINLWLLRRVVQSERLRLRDLYNLSRHDRKGDLWWLVIGLVGAALFGFAPNILLAQILFGDLQTPSDLMIRSIPILAAWTVVGAFPVLHALTELPTYFGYVMPRLQLLTGRPTAMLILTASVLSAQHVFLPLLFDWRFILWRLLMFLPFALWVGWLIHRRPTVLPYLAAVHGLLDLTLPIYILQASLGH